MALTTGSPRLGHGAFAMMGGGAVNTVAPVISGAVYVKQLLSATTGTWLNGDSFAYQWRRAGAAISGATSSTYTVALADEGQDITCVVTTLGVSATSNTLRHWSPLDISSSIVWWFDAEDTTRITLATGISSWADRNGSGIAMTQATGANQPAWSATGWDGTRASATFTAPNNWLGRTTSTALYKNVASGLHLSLVNLTATATSQQPIMVSSGSTAGANRFTQAITPAGALGVIGRRNDGDAVTTVNTGTATYGVDNAMMTLVQWSSALTWSRVNGLASSTAGFLTSGNTSNTNSLGQALGSTPTGSASWANGKVRELISLNTIPATSVLEKLEAYILWRAGDQARLTSGHVWASTPPTV